MVGTFENRLSATDLLLSTQIGDVAHRQTPPELKIEIKTMLAHSVIGTAVAVHGVHEN